MGYTDQQVTEALHAAVMLKGADYVYRQPSELGCVYADEDGSPSCLVGHVIHALNPEGFKRFLAMPSLNTYWFGALSDVHDFGFSEKQTEALGYAQDAQDGMETWGSAERAYLVAFGEDAA